MAGPAGEVFAAGRYLIAYNALPLGLMEGDAGVPTIEVATHAEEVRNTDGYGKTLVEAFNQGADVSAQWTALEYKQATLQCLWPFVAQVGAAPLIGGSYYLQSKPLTMTAVLGTPAASAGPLTITAMQAIIAPNFNFRLLYGPTLRKLPIRMSLLPYLVNGSGVWYTVT